MRGKTMQIVAGSEPLAFSAISRQPDILVMADYLSELGPSRHPNLIISPGVGTYGKQGLGLCSNCDNQ
jgi:hypothetical protein